MAQVERKVDLNEHGYVPGMGVLELHVLTDSLKADGIVPLDVITKLDISTYIHHGREWTEAYITWIEMQ